MSRIVSSAIFVLMMTCVLYAGEEVTTGDLIMSLKNSLDWPPVHLSRPELAHTFDTDNFRIHYDTEGDNAVYHADEDIDPSDGIPDYVNRMAEFLEASRYTYIELLGYDIPAPDTGLGGNENYDIYVTEVTGLTVPEFRSNYYPNRLAYAAYSFIGRDLRTQNHPDDPLPFLMATCSHEYFHAIQLAYRAFTSDETAWWYELTANWAEERVFDDLNELYYYLEDYYNKIDRSIYLTGGSHMYGAWPFAEFLSQNYEIDIIKLIFEKLISLNYSVDAVGAALTEAGISLSNAFTEFACWNYFTSGNYRAGFFEEGMDFPVGVPIANSHVLYPTGWIDTPKAVENLGSAYICFTNPDISKGDLVVQFGSSSLYSEGVSLAAVYLDRPVEYSVHVVGPGEIITLRIDDFSNCEKAILSISWLYQGSAIHDSAGYQYEAYLDSSSVAIGPESSESPQSLSLFGNYPNPFNLSCNIIFSWNSRPVDYTIYIYDIAGRHADRLSGTARVGTNTAVWAPAEDIAGGVYFYRLLCGDFEVKEKMVLLK